MRTSPLLSGLLLAAAFAPLERPELAWIAFVPMLLGCRKKSIRQAAWTGWLCGSVFFLCSLFWLHHVTWTGWILLSLFCALFFIPLPVLFSHWHRTHGTTHVAANLSLMILTAVAWAGMEHLRSTLFTGFPWNTLAVSQWRNISIIQISALGGTALLSALIILVNTAIALTVLQYTEHKAWKNRRPHFELMSAFLLVALATSYGWRTLLRQPEAETGLNIALIQPSIPQHEKWTPEHVEKIYDRLQTLSEKAKAEQKPDLLIWPETALPDFTRLSRRSTDLIRQVTADGTALLTGSMDLQWTETGTLYYNSAMLFTGSREPAMQYDKQHLVVFGEYVPFADRFPFLKALTPIRESFSPGSGNTLFRFRDDTPPFSTLICFEDTVAPLAREAVRNGARWLINLTNDGWFEPSAQSRQHLAHSVFRAAENRVPLVRCANTGISCAVDPHGRVYGAALGENGETGLPAFSLTRTAFAPCRETFHTRHGEWFAKGCLHASILLPLLAILRKRLKKK